MSDLLPPATHLSTLVRLASQQSHPHAQRPVGALVPSNYSTIPATGCTAAIPTQALTCHTPTPRLHHTLLQTIKKHNTRQTQQKLKLKTKADTSCSVASTAEVTVERFAYLLQCRVNCRSASHPFHPPPVGTAFSPCCKRLLGLRQRSTTAGRVNRSQTSRGSWTGVSTSPILGSHQGFFLQA